jgi:hypothetical protein
MKRLCVLVLVLWVVGAAPARGHEEITPPTFRVGTPTFLTLTVANEKQVKLTRLTLGAPAGATPGETTRDPAGWTSSRTGAAVTWTGASVEPGRFESFGFEVDEVEQPGILAYKATLGYADGTSEDATVEVTATAAAAPAGAGTAQGGSGRADLALAVAALALLASLVALVRSSGRGRSGPSAEEAEQDW